jgi:DNA repair exonuclease SbcCD nuclease subunit
MSKAIITADVHLGYRQYGLKEREEDFEKSFEYIVNYAIDGEDIDAIYVAGDFLNSKRPSSRTMMYLLKLHRKLIEGKVTCYIMDGNHDACKPSWVELVQEYSSAEYPNEEGGFHSLNSGTSALCGYTVSVCPYFEANKVLEWAKTAKPSEVLLLHLPVQQFIGYPSDTALDIDKFPVDKFKYIFIGDTHVNKVLHLIKDNHTCTVISPGSTELNSTGEQSDKYFYEVSATDESTLVHEKIPCRTRKVVTIDVKTDEDLDKAIADIKAAEDENPIVMGKFDANVDNVMTRIKQTVNTDKVILQLKGTVAKTAANFEGTKQVDRPVSDYVKEHIPEDSEAYQLAYTLVNDREDPSSHVDAYTENRLKELEKS